ncbi:MAG: endonuclease III [Candidatus Paceibacterota bacterium]|jgi:endonuclease-3
MVKNNNQIKKIMMLLNGVYGDPKTALDFKTPHELLVATILSAQCTDKRVNLVTKELFKKYKNVADYVGADVGEFEKDIRSTGFYRNKAKNIINSAKMIFEKFGSKVPDTMEELVTLPGVARKTANIVLTEAYGKVEGIAVDTHVLRLSLRLGLSQNSNAEKVEKDLMKITPKEDWGKVSNLLIMHGRNVCFARKPNCIECVLNKICPSVSSFRNNP